MLYDQETEDRYIPLANLSPTQARYEVINSMLSEEAVLGFEYGYSLARPNALTLWEAQFGDFANGAQVVFDQFISSGERKWLRMSGLVCLLPHGYEGQGPEHSSARLERWLQMCAEDNMQVANVTTPANYFHILRRQVKRDFRKPLILMTPKSLLRHKRAVSSLSEMAGESSFHRLLWDDAEVIKDGPIKLQKDAKIRRVVLCTGKVYYDLLEEREKRGIDDVYLLRVEQLYPFPAKALINELSRFRNAEMVWCQEEPKNMGAWSFIDPYLEWVLAHIDAKYQRVRYTGRPAAASPATGLMSKHLPSSPPSSKMRWAAKREGAMAYFHLKLVPPRRTFPHDATGEEMAAMERHADYWRREGGSGTAIAVGPVFEGDGRLGHGGRRGRGCRRPRRRLPTAIRSSPPASASNSKLLPIPSLILRHSSAPAA